MIKLELIKLALAVLPTLLRLLSKLTAAMAQAIEQLKAAAAASNVGQAPSGSSSTGSNVVGGQTSKEQGNGGQSKPA